ncbi:hypothetical protein FBEOM_13053 [Fusarium beomiforme]|uniref:Uncharacterized protein n=1 Tax=Fusarium beomiforme TaxID=44412 RepID=A0A9P5A6E3_9HYPO|nr:hypothetical protein FBEOM_13053 [Fusarium beomiforme]
MQQQPSAAEVIAGWADKERELHSFWEKNADAILNHHIDLYLTYEDHKTLQLDGRSHLLESSPSTTENHFVFAQLGALCPWEQTNYGVGLRVDKPGTPGAVSLVYNNFETEKDVREFYHAIRNYNPDRKRRVKDTNRGLLFDGCKECFEVA